MIHTVSFEGGGWGKCDGEHIFFDAIAFKIFFASLYAGYLGIDNRRI